jgi:hypothetical protein
VSRCVHCGEQAGLLRREHAACRERHDNAVTQFPGFFVKYLASPMPPDKFRALADEIAAGAFIRGDEFKQVCAGGLKAMIDTATTGGELKPEDSSHIATLAETFGIDLHALKGAGERLVKASVLRDLRGGRLPADIRLDGPVVLNLERDESVVWVFNQVACYSVARSDKPATHSQHVGHSQLTMRMNGFKAVTTASENDAKVPPEASLAKSGAKRSSAQPDISKDERTQGLALDGTGDLVLTNRHLCFLSDSTVLKIPLRAIVAVVPHADGLRVMRDEASGKPQTFVVDDPSFAATAITLLNRL